MKIVADTNVLISAFVFPGGNADTAIRLVRRGEVELCVSPFIIEEFQRVLRRKFGYSARRSREFARVITSLASLVEPQERVSAVKDDDDNRILEAAVCNTSQFR